MNRGSSRAELPDRKVDGDVSVDCFHCCYEWEAERHSVGPSYAGWAAHDAWDHSPYGKGECVRVRCGMPRRSLLDVFWRLGSRPYDRMYRSGAPWESGPRGALVELCESGRVTPGAIGGALAVDLGCGSGADSIYLAQQGFSVTGVDFSHVAISKAQAAATDAGVVEGLEFVVADLLTLPDDQVSGPFDLLFDGGTIDDFPPAVRPQIAETVTNLARSGAVFVMWCFYADPSDLPLMSLGGPSRYGAPPIEPGEETALFGKDWVIDRLDLTDPSPHEACFVMNRN